MKLEHNNETLRFVEDTANSMGESLQFNNVLSKLINKVMEPSFEKLLVKAYRDYGVKIDTVRYRTKELTDNPYFKNIKLAEVNTDRVKYDTVTLPAKVIIGMGFTQYADKLGKSYIDVGYFDRDVKIPRLIEGENIWMSPTISEQRTIQPHVEKAKGKVLTFGLGIGYYVYMCLLKEEVESITVVEINEDIINVFNEYIKPQFPKADNIKIIHGDLYDYYNDEFMRQYDTIFVDVWQNNTDGAEHFKKLQALNVNVDNIGYWIEDSLLEDVKSALLVYITARFKGEYLKVLNSVSRENYKNLIAINKYFSEDETVYSSYEQLIELVNNRKVLRELAGRMA